MPPRRPPAPRASTPPGRALAAGLLLLALHAVPGAVRAQSESYTLRVPPGPSVTFPADSVKEMLQRSRALETVLQEDPDVLYYVGTGDDVSAADPGPAYPWHAVRPQSDSVARISVPGNYREARRAYYNYAVETMKRIRGEGPAARCETAVESEAEVVSAFVDGWVVARTLFGGPSFPALDAFVFAREAGHLRAMIVALGDTRLGGCTGTWARDHAGALEAYRAWRQRFDAAATTDASAADGSG